MTYTDRHLSQISFPVGGIGAGCVGLSGTGRLIDWEIFNRPDKLSTNGMSHFSVRAERDGRVIDMRVLQGDLPPPYQGTAAAGGKFFGPGFGPDYSLMCGWPHFRSCAFEGFWPSARIAFSDPSFPGAATLSAWSPFVPGESRTSSLPAACFEIALTNTSGAETVYSCIGALSNPWSAKGHRNEVAGRTLTCRSNPGGQPQSRRPAGDVSLTLLDGEGSLSWQTYWYRGGWCDARETFWRDAMRGGDFADRLYADEADIVDTGHLCLRFALAPGESRTVRFLLTWNIPERENYWNPAAAELAQKAGLENRWRNYYATQWADSRASAAEFAARFDEIAAKVVRFRDALAATTLPAPMLEGISANLSTLVSPTCQRLEDGTFYGFEGVGSSWGSCEGSCTHVWNYAQALPFLFPDLERSMREANFRFGTDENGASHFRLQLPLGIKATPDMFRACADGQFGDVMKAYRDWMLSGDDAWLAAWWPTIKALVSYAWSERNPDRWDPDRSGLLTGRQHHTLDMELFGPNGWLSSIYLGALKAAAEMAIALEDFDFAGLCDEILAKGRAAIGGLFRDGHFCQNVDLKDRSVVDRFDAARTYWNAEAGEIKYQIGDGCGIDGALGQFFATLYGIGDVLDPEQVQTHLRTVFARNFRPSMRDFFNPWRNYTVDDEGGVLICTWKEGAAPAIPIPYNTETMNGFEWTFAAHLATAGLLDEATQVAAAIRARYDGEKRNPYNEIECGGNYARSMAAYALLPAWSGFTFNLRTGTLGFAPKTDSAFTAFWSVDGAWGTFSRSGRTARLDILHGSLDLRRLELGFDAQEVLVNGKPFANFVTRE